MWCADMRPLTNEDVGTFKRVDGASIAEASAAVNALLRRIIFGYNTVMM